MWPFGDHLIYGEEKYCLSDEFCFREKYFNRF